MTAQVIPLAAYRCPRPVVPEGCSLPPAEYDRLRELIVQARDRNRAAAEPQDTPPAECSEVEADAQLLAFEAELAALLSEMNKPGASDELQDRLHPRTRDLEKLIAETPATGMTGAIVKLRWALWDMKVCEHDIEDHLFAIATALETIEAVAR